MGPPRGLADLHRDSGLWYLARVAFENVFNGPAAVAMFFIISGFCIHFPFRGDMPAPRPLLFYARRNIRILLPAGVAIAISPLVGIPIERLLDSILWSLICEEIYYLLYPWLRRAAGHSSWPLVGLLGALGALLLMFAQPAVGRMNEFGIAWAWLAGLPYWLAGVLLAERWDSLHALAGRPPKGMLLALRTSMVLSAALSNLAMFHSPFGFPWTLPFVGAIGFYWLRAEALEATAAGKGSLDTLGAASYSIYLFHPFAFGLAGAFVAREGGAPPSWAWPASLSLTLLVCSALYFVVERPSHRLARRLFRVASGVVPPPAAIESPS